MTFKKLLASIFSIIIVLSSFLIASANTLDFDKPQTVSVGYTLGYGGVNDFNSVSKKGYLYDVFTRLSDYSDFNFKFVEYNSIVDATDALNNGEIDFFGPLLKTNEKIDNNWNFIELTSTTISLVTKDNNSNFYYDDPSSIDGKTIASYESSNYDVFLNEYCDKHNISVNYIKGTANNYSDLDADLYLTSSNFNDFADYKTVINLTTRPMYIASTNSLLNEQIKESYLTMLNDDPNFLYEVHDKYYSNNTSQQRGLTKENYETLTSKTLKVAFTTDHDFFSYLNSKGEPDGLLVDLFNYALTKFGVTDIEYLPYSLNGTGSNSVEYIKENSDIIISSMGNPEDYQDNFSLSEQYLDVSLTAIIDNELYYYYDNKSKPKVGRASNMYFTSSNSSIYSNYNFNINDDFIIYDNLEQMYEDFNNDVIDGFLASETGFIYVDQQLSREYFTAESNAVTKLKLLVSNELGKEFPGILDIVFDQLNPNKIDELVLTEQSKYKATPNFFEFLKANLVLVVLILTLIGSLILLIIVIMLRHSQKQTKKLLEVDALTGLMSRYKFVNEVQSILSFANPDEYFLMAIDIDNFKHFNKSYGSPQGDKLLCSLSSILDELSSYFVCLCRLHNDNFVALLRNKASKDIKASSVADEGISFDLVVQNHIEKSLNKLYYDRPIYFSVGVYFITNPNEKLNYMIDCVLAAKTIGKNTFGNTFIVFTEDIKQKLEKENEIITSMEKAISKNEFFLNIQPKIDLTTRKIAGGEVLVRWKKQNNTLLNPIDFIPLFEKNNFIINLDYYVLDKTCEYISNSSTDMPLISVNVSAATLLQSDFIETSLHTLNKYSISPSQLEFELTETTLDLNYNEIAKTLKKLNQIGFTIAIDDFGKGASSLARIRELDIHVLKFDKEFIDDNVLTEKGKLVLRNIISMSNDLGFKTLAEGIETKQQEAVLIELGCSYGQGYYYDKPLSPDVFAKKIQDNNELKPASLIHRPHRLNSYWSNFDSLPHGIAIVSNDPFSTIIQANNAFYDIIGHTKESFQEVHKNRFTEILYDNLYTLVKKYLEDKQYSFSYDLRILTQNQDVVWIHDIVEFDPQSNLFFITIIDITEENKSISKSSTYDEYSLQKEIAKGLNNQTSDYIYVTDMINDNILYLNQNLVEFFNFKEESEWLGKKYFNIFYGTDYPLYFDFYDKLSENEFSQIEYYNKHLNMYVLVKAKLIDINGLLVRLHIVKDITSQHEVENNLILQTTLMNCVGELYSRQEKHISYERILYNISNYYNSRSAYFLELNLQLKALSNIYSVSSIENASLITALNEISQNEFLQLIDIFGKLNNSYYSKDQLINFNLSSAIINFFEKSDLQSLLIVPIKDDQDRAFSFIAVGNPQKNTNKTNLLQLLSGFIGVTRSNDELKNFEKDALQAEESSKIEIVTVCDEILQLNNNPNDSLIYILSLLLSHYNANSAVIFKISEDMQYYTIANQTCDNHSAYEFDNSKQFDISLLDSVINEMNTENGVTVTSLSNLQNISTKEKEFWASHNLKEVYFSAIKNKDNKIDSILAIGNPKFSTRSMALIQVIAKLISDYTEKLALTKISNESLSIDSLTGLFNKVSTEQKIDELLSSNCVGTMYMIDIDNFKTINDTLGHSKGDEVISDLSKLLQEAFRKDDIIGRIGGDEFIVFCPNLIHETSIYDKANLILNTFKKTYRHNDKTVQTTASVGIYKKTEKLENFQSMYQKSDEALYVAKRNGKGKFSFYTN